MDTLLTDEKRFHNEGVKIFEVVDATNDEIYYPIGLFASLHDAIKAIKAYGKDEAIGEFSGLYERIEVRERRIGYCGVGKQVYKCERDALGIAVLASKSISVRE